MRGNHREDIDFSHCRPHCSLASHIGGMLVRGAVAVFSGPFSWLDSHWWRIEHEGFFINYDFIRTTSTSSLLGLLHIAVFSGDTIRWDNRGRQTIQVVQSDGDDTIQMVPSDGVSADHGKFT